MRRINIQLEEADIAAVDSLGESVGLERAALIRGMIKFFLMCAKTFNGKRKEELLSAFIKAGTISTTTEASPK